MRILVTVFLLAVALSSGYAQPYGEDTEISLESSDGLVLYGDLYDPDESQPLILLFHQGGGNGRAEYGPLVPRLLDEGYSALAVDLRRGGERLGGTNRTVDRNPNGEWTYCDAAPDLSAVLDFAKTHFENRSIVLWGSSYSAALAIRLAVERPEDVVGVLAFSPASGDPMEGCRPEAVSGDLEVPALILRPDREAEIESVKAQLDSFSKQGHRTFVSENGVHGSSMLNHERTKSDTEPAWKEVVAFLQTLVET